MKVSSRIPFASRCRASFPALLLAAVGLSLCSLPAQAQRAFAQRYATIANGDIAGIGNINMHCDPAAGTAGQQAACVASRTHTDGSGGLNNNSTGVSMVHHDVDGDPATFNSSSATLDLPPGSMVLFAGLYWSGQASPTTPGRDSVRFAGPGGGYSTVTANQFDSLVGQEPSHPDYQGFADVTAQVAAAGNGVYTVADIATSRNATNNTWAGWSLVVAYRNNSMPTRSLSVFDGWLRADGVNPILDLSVGPFVTPPTGPVNSTLGVLTWDGDRASNDHASLPGLSFGTSAATLNPVSNGINPVNNFWNSTVSVNGAHVTAGRTPDYSNTLGMDLDFQPPDVQLPNGATSAAIRLRGSSSEVMDIGMVSLATDVFAPDLVSSIVKDVTDDNGGDVEPGDVLTYTISFDNSGQDGATNVLVTDPVPAGTTYVPGSLVILTNNTDDGGATNGGPTGAMSDAADGDQAEFAGGSVVFRLGEDDSAFDGGTGPGNGGLISAGHAASFRFQVTVDADVAPGATITNTAGVTHNAQTIPDFDASGSASASVTVTDEADLSIIKEVTPNSARIGDEVTYVLQVGNAGPLAADGAIVSDPAVTGLDCSAAVIACSATGDAECPVTPTIAGLQGAGLVIPVLPVGGGVRIEFACEVTATP
ncbi:DUF11 domain-containing protein [Luteimonas saliphila]|uniref:DUF11 domain-containing protein n=1 Tax=Luteimonas saliphila TaxID=2804919 RepID=UPI00192D585C|nr:DUF11 domain-containing protein [Luteimonas saliphila]